MKASLRLAVATGVVGAALLTVAWHKPRTVPFGFSPAHAAAHADVERRFLHSTNTDRIRDAHAFIAGEPHMAGSARDRALAEWVRDTFRGAGLEDVAISTHEVLLPWPQETSIEMTSPRPWRAAMRERPARGDPFTESDGWGPTRNPWNTSRSPGGASGGSGAAVAAGHAGVGLAPHAGG